jgi:zinc protease
LKIASGASFPISSIGNLCGPMTIPRHWPIFALVGVLSSCGLLSPSTPELSPSRQEDRLAAPARDLPPIAIAGHVFHRRLLGNGLHAIAVQDEEEGVSVFMVVAAGKRQETADTTGLAHLTEHAMYTGTERTGPGEHDRIIRAMGGESNAFTREDYTLYYDHGIPSERLREVLAMEADRLRNLTLPEAAVHREREALRIEETRTWQPSQYLTEQLEAAVYRRHPYGAGIIDEEGHTLAPGLGVPEIRDFYDRHYRPNNTTVVVAGSVDPLQALDAIDEAFGSLPPGTPPPPLPEEPEVTEPRSVRLPSRLPSDRVEWVWLVPAMGHPDRPALEVLARLLSRQAIENGTPLFVSMGGRVDKELFRVALTGEEASEGLEKALGGVLELKAEDRVAESQVEEIKGQLTDTLARQTLRARPYFSLAGTFAVYEALGHTVELVGYQDAIRRVSLEDVLRAGRRYLDPEKRISVQFVGTGAEPAPLPEDLNELQRAADQAAQSGDLDRAVQAYTALLARDLNKMSRVIALASRGQVRIRQRDYDGAILDFETALEVIEYPALRDLLDEARALKAGVAVPDALDEEGGRESPHHRGPVGP